MGHEVKLKTIAAQPTLGIRVLVDPEHVGTALAELVPQVVAYAAEVNVELKGAPFARYLEFGGDGISVEFGVPVARRTEGRDSIVPGELPGGRALSTWHVGPYDGLPEAVRALLEFARAGAHEPASPHWETYVVNPSSGEKPEHFQTELVLPLQPPSASSDGSPAEN